MHTPGNTTSAWKITPNGNRPLREKRFEYVQNDFSPYISSDNILRASCPFLSKVGNFQIIFLD